MTVAGDDRFPGGSFLNKARAILINKRDNVATVVVDVSAGDEVDCGPHQVKAREAIPLGHKIALRNLQEGEVVLKYGESIAAASRPIKKGEWVHVHNIASQSAQVEEPESQ